MLQAEHTHPRNNDGEQIIILGRIIGTLCLLGLATVALAQETRVGVTRHLITTDHVKPEMTSEWLTLQENEVVPALKKAGVAERKVYHTVLGDTTEFISYVPFPDYGEMDGPDPLERALGKGAADSLKRRLAAHMMGPEETAEFFRAGTGLISPLGQYIHRYEAAISYY
jgi:hypothetical protein